MEEILPYLRDWSTGGALAVFIWLQWKGHIRWGRDCEDDKKELETLRQTIDLIHKQRDEKLERVEQELNELRKGGPR